MKKIVTIAFIFICTQSFAQLTKKDFKLYLDNIASSDSTSHITKQQLLNAKELTANFPWLTIKSFSIAMSTGGNTICNMAQEHIYDGNVLTNDTKKFLASVDSGWIVIIDIRGYNRQGIEIDWPAIPIIIK
ncbi:MAG TPA: hypothetical protein VK559_04215 [Ferruginibacter sp.]|nr:hypothetical protein [Ferruginibacter sp.]